MGTTNTLTRTNETGSWKSLKIIKIKVKLKSSMTQYWTPLVSTTIFEKHMFGSLQHKSPFDSNEFMWIMFPNWFQMFPFMCSRNSICHSFYGVFISLNKTKKNSVNLENHDIKVEVKYINITLPSLERWKFVLCDWNSHAHLCACIFIHSICECKPIRSVCHYIAIVRSFVPFSLGSSRSAFIRFSQYGFCVLPICGCVRRTAATDIC